jgi:hypothetical protein
MNMRVVVSALGLALAGAAGLSPAVSQDKPAASTTIDPRVQPLIGTWEGRVKFAKSKSEESRVLTIMEKAGRLHAQYGVEGKKLEPVDLAVDAASSRLKVSFVTSAGNNVTLELAREGWLTGVFGLTGGARSGGSAERQIDFEKKK